MSICNSRICSLKFLLVFDIYLAFKSFYVIYILFKVIEIGMSHKLYVLFLCPFNISLEYLIMLIFSLSLSWHKEIIEALLNP